MKFFTTANDLEDVKICVNFIFFSCLRYNKNVFGEYCMIIWYTLQKDSQPSSYLKHLFFFPVRRFNSTLLAIFSYTLTIQYYQLDTMLCFRISDLIYIITEVCTLLPASPHFPNLSVPGNHHSTLWVISSIYVFIAFYV